MNVLHLSHTATVSGAEHSLLTLILAMPPDAEAGLACPDGELEVRATAAGIEVHRLPPLQVSLRISPATVPATALGLFRAAVALRRIATRTGATVIHANSIRAALIAIAARGLAGPPIVVHVRDVLPPGRIPLLLRRTVRRRTRAVVALSDYVAERFGDGNRRGADVVVVDNPVDLERFVPGLDARGATRRELGVPPDAPLLGIVGQITSWKGHDTLIRSLALLAPRHADASLLVVGAIKFADPSTRLDNRAFLSFLETEITRLGLDGRVVFAGERNDIPAVLAALDVLLVPSVEEPFGRTVAEAMAVGTPVIATNVGGPAEIVDDGITGLLVRPGAPTEWAHAITRMLDDRDGAQIMADRAREVALIRFDAHLHAERMQQLFEAASAP